MPSVWGDDLSELQAKILEMSACHVDLPSSVKIDDEWMVDVVWVFNSSSKHPVGCFPEKVRLIDDCLVFDREFRECPQRIRDLAEVIPKNLFRTYCENFIKKRSKPMDER